jgi:hypothetical protein
MSPDQVPPVIEIDCDDAALLLNGNLCLPSHVFVFPGCVLPDQLNERAGPLQMLPTDTLDVLLVVGVDRAIELTVRKVHVDVFMRLPALHLREPPFVCAAEANECMRAQG